MQRRDLTGMATYPAGGRVRETVARPLAFGRQFVRRGGNYAATIRWLLNRTFRGHTSKLGAVFVLSLFYLAGQAAAIFALYWYAQQMQTDAIVSLQSLGIEWRAREEPVLLWIIVTVSAVCFIASASFLFASRTLVMKLVENDLARGLTQLIGFARRLPDPCAPLASQLIGDHGLKGPTAGCRFGAFTAVNFCNALPPAVGAIGAVAVLLWVDAALTTLILVAVVLWSTLLYPLTLRAVWFANQRRRARVRFAAEAGELLGPRSSAPAAVLESATRLAEASLGKRRVSNEMTFLVQIGATIIVVLSVFYLAHDLMTRGGNWPIFVAYVGGLRMALTGGFQVVRTFAGVSRFYPHVAAFVQFMRSAQRIDEDSLGHVQAGDALVLGTLQDGTDVRARIGDRIAVASASEPALLRLALVHARAARSGQPLATACPRAGCHRDLIEPFRDDRHR